jgi:hypothetical protein
MSPEHREIRESLGAWAMGHLDRSERAMVDEHLATCAECWREAESLEQTGAMLELVDPALVGSLSEPLPQPPPELEARVIAGMRDPGAAKPHPRRYGRRILIPAAGILVAVIVGLILVLGSSNDGAAPGGSGQQFAFTSLPPGVTIDGRVEPKATGTSIEVKVEGMKPGTLCRVYAQTGAGKLEPAGTFRYRYDAEEGESYPATLSTAWDLSEIDALVIKAGGRTFSTSI